MKRRLGALTILVCGLLFVTQAQAGQSEVKQKAKSATVTLNVIEVPASVALDYVAKASGIPIATRGNWNDAPKVTADLKDVPVTEAVAFIAKLVNAQTTVEDAGLSARRK